jgi:thiol-disulfide isomerase/thioredoxin
VNFWATWCAPCVKELPYFQALDTSYSKDELKLTLVSLDFPEKLESKLIPFVEKHKIKDKVVLLDAPNENEWIPKIDANWSGAIPATIIFNKEKRAFYEQSFTKEQLFEEVEKFTKNIK